MSSKETEWEAGLKPIVEISEINRQALERLTTLQAECFSDLMETSLKQWQMMLTGNPQSFGTLQMNYIRELEGKIQQTAEKELDTLTEAQQKITDLMGSGYQHQRQFLNEISPNPTPV